MTFNDRETSLYIVLEEVFHVILVSVRRSQFPGFHFKPGREDITVLVLLEPLPVLWSIKGNEQFILNKVPRVSRVHSGCIHS